MPISQVEKERGAKTENVTTLNVERATDSPSPRSSSWITATLKGNKSEMRSEELGVKEF